MIPFAHCPVNEQVLASWRLLNYKGDDAYYAEDFSTLDDVPVKLIHYKEDLDTPIIAIKQASDSHSVLLCDKNGNCSNPNDTIVIALPEAAVEVRKLLTKLQWELPIRLGNVSGENQDEYEILFGNASLLKCVRNQKTSYHTRVPLKDYDLLYPMEVKAIRGMFDSKSNFPHGKAKKYILTMFLLECVYCRNANPSLTRVTEWSKAFSSQVKRDFGLGSHGSIDMFISDMYDELRSSLGIRITQSLIEQKPISPIVRPPKLLDDDPENIESLLNIHRSYDYETSTYEDK